MRIKSAKDIQANTPVIDQFKAKPKEARPLWNKHWLIIRLVFLCGGNGHYEYLWPDLKWRSYSMQENNQTKDWKEGKHAWLKTRDDAIALLTKWQETQKDIPPFLKEKTDAT